MLSSDKRKNILLENLFSSNSWSEPTKHNQLILNSIEESYYNDIKDYNYIKSLTDLKENVKCGGLIRYFTYDGDIRYGGILLKKIFIKKNDIDDAILVIKNTSGNIWKFHFNNYYVFFNSNNRNDKIRNLFINFLPDSAKEEYEI